MADTVATALAVVNPQLPQQQQQQQQQGAAPHRRLGTGAFSNRYYCGGPIGRDRLIGSNGFCGPHNGPQCAECERFQYRQVMMIATSQTSDAAIFSGEGSSLHHPRGSTELLSPPSRSHQGYHHYNSSNGDSPLRMNNSPNNRSSPNHHNASSSESASATSSSISNNTQHRQYQQLQQQQQHQQQQYLMVQDSPLPIARRSTTPNNSASLIMHSSHHTNSPSAAMRTATTSSTSRPLTPNPINNNNNNNSHSPFNNHHHSYATSSSSTMTMMMVNALNPNLTNPPQLAGGSGKYADKYYCGKFYGYKLVGSDGYCGPFDGPQCMNCLQYQIQKQQEVIDELKRENETMRWGISASAAAAASRKKGGALDAGNEPSPTNEISASFSNATLNQTCVTTSSSDMDTSVPIRTTLSGGECKVCFENPINAVFIPCGHMICCYDCGTRSTTTTNNSAAESSKKSPCSSCPVCRGPNSKCIRVYEC